MSPIVAYNFNNIKIIPLIYTRRFWKMRMPNYKNEILQLFLYQKFTSQRKTLCLMLF